MNKSQALAAIDEEIKTCPICPEDKIGKPVPGEGSATAQVVFIGEAPGKQEAATGRPFIGRSGKFLRSQIQMVGLSEESVYITSPVKYLPTYGTPKPKDILHGKTHLDKQLAIINPKIIVLLGSVASFAVLGEKIPVAKDHGKILTKGRTRFFISFHPAAAIRFKRIRTLFLEDFIKLAQALKEL